MSKHLIFLAVACIILEEVAGHGYMIWPMNRASLWRQNDTKLPNYEDNEFFCGGVDAQYKANGGKCGVCGDNWALPRPRPNENTGYYGDGTVLATYRAGDVIATKVVLTANHIGTFTFSLCNLPDPNQPEPDDCFVDLKLANGLDMYYVNLIDYEVINYVQLPEGLTCERCVLRWHYRTGNSWGMCPDGMERMGCGDQEVFRSCADIIIY